MEVFLWDIQILFFQEHHIDTAHTPNSAYHYQKHIPIQFSLLEVDN
ncbi:hypothetical protein C4K38_6341 [Pseudomonas chlororaphis subsp. piscium]|nr:hypothetical protein C4K38_6341 [Pseudomonas chlororaphis subsp. piscium]AZC72776.1 hypothetical protein C4K32_6159 [Pseudomonas chlororaphis subsp. piscium]AZC85322.1 hypothetical protein C4K30_6253 [Pseudomonas chlororaphis subsp. piscium]AZD82705.1 hypothetical protein C4K15_6183 [Pseudomonas chlororaphis subsp. aurantiaca]